MLGLITSSAVIVHLSGGVVEAHFHFFVMVEVITLYQDWLPFGLALGYVVVHHSALGMLNPAGVFNHPEELPRELERARRMRSELCVAIIDLDNFRAYNDIVERLRTPHPPPRGPLLGG